MGDILRVTDPGDPAVEVLVRMPALPELVTGGWLPVPLVHSVAPDESGRPVWIRPDPEAERAREAGRLAQWLVLVLVQPKVTATGAGDGETLGVDELSPALRRAIWRCTYAVLEARQDAAAAAAAPFFEDATRVAAIDQAAQRYGRRPSELVGLTDPAAAFDFDLAVASLASQYLQALAAQGTTH